MNLVEPVDISGMFLCLQLSNFNSCYVITIIINRGGSGKEFSRVGRLAGNVAVPQIDVFQQQLRDNLVESADSLKMILRFKLTSANG